MTSKGKVSSSFNIFKHVLVPKHEILPKEEAEKIIKKYGGKSHLFPLISVNDPASITLGAKPGDLIKITRKSPTGKVSIYYRLVVKE